MSRWLHKKLKLSHKRHSGKLLPHKHTSHGALLIILLTTGVMLFMATRSIAATALTLNESGDIGLSGEVPGAPPGAPVILVPKDGDSFSSSPIDVSGTCPANTFIEIYKNGILAGATNCISQTFGLKIDLVIGVNELIAKAKDNLNQYSPDSNKVTVTYGPVSPPKGQIPPGSPQGAPGAPAYQFIVIPDSEYFGTYAGNLFKLAITIRGGVQPYAISVDWGDKHQDVVPRNSEGRFETSHVYKYGQVYYITINGTDTAGNKAYSQTAVLMAGPKPAKPAEVVSEYPLLAVIWPMYISALGAVTTFWLGEKYEKQKLSNMWKRSKRK